MVAWDNHGGSFGSQAGGMVFEMTIPHIANVMLGLSNQNNLVNHLDFTDLGLCESYWPVDPFGP